MATRSFQVAITSRPWSLTVEAATASRDFRIEMSLEAMKIGAKRTRPGIVPTDITTSLPTRYMRVKTTLATENLAYST